MQKLVHLIREKKAFLFDIEGTLLEKEKALPGAIFMVKKAYDQGKKIFFISNTTSFTKEALREKMVHLGFPSKISTQHIFTGLSVLEDYLQNYSQNAYLLVDERVEKNLKAFIKDNNAPYDTVIVGNAKNRFTFESLNKALNILLTHKAKLVAVARSHHYSLGEGIFSLDSGAYTVLLEYGALTQATILGKPNPSFFLSPLKKEGLFENEAILFGDDIENDITPCLELGITGVLLKTGKAQNDKRQNKTESPYFVLNSFEDLNGLL
jgi:HAD superfamily hydrolase (TIGR01458 family)